MNIDQAKEHVRRGELAKDEANASLEAARARHTEALTHVEATAREQVEAAARLAREPGAPATKRARDARAAHEDAGAVAAILSTDIATAARALDEATAALAEARGVLRSAQREADLDEAATVERERRTLQASADALAQQVQALLTKHTSGLPGAYRFEQEIADLQNEIRVRLGESPLDTMTGRARAA